MWFLCISFSLFVHMIDNQNRIDLHSGLVSAQHLPPQDYSLLKGSTSEV